ncbi:hypothetical protein [Denitrobaculum tricleocarpae]|uniref:VOC domain-containing protein n=1 Tax=Denitrobaculum tricleocarpae TaxID=2591009 RepID=A0A545TXT5_9PROT|nr:hypothetical protein [Denitrobaculum tricleocarpae]TQV82033.1 hypothetical protein FKG95_07305 [Denitrobaculum tricleocarpae]
MMTSPGFKPGTNIAMKLPAHLFDQTVSFYEETLSLPVEYEEESAVVDFGAVRLWLDKVPAMTQPELWLEVTTPDTVAASDYLQQQGVVRCDQVEPLPEGLDGFWIAAPGGIVHLVAREA